MKSKLTRGVVAALVVIGLATLTLTGCGAGPFSSTSSTGSAMVVTVGDAPLSNILSAKVTISTITLTPSNGGAAVSVMPEQHTIELSSLGAIQEPLDTDDVPDGTYKAVNITVSSATVTYINSSGQVVTGTATVNSPSDTVTLNPALTVAQEQDDAHLRLDFNLAQSFDLTGSTLTFTPSITAAAASIQDEDEADREVEVTGSVVSVNSTSITVQSACTGVQSTFTINSSTQFSSGLTAANIKTGSIVTVHGTVQTDGTLLATRVSAMSEDDNDQGTSQDGGIGIVTAVTTSSSGSVTSFTFVPRENFGDVSSNTLTVVLSSSTTYGVSGDAIADGISSTAFTNAEIFLGQSVAVIGTVSGSGSVAAQEVDLAPESLYGTLTTTPQAAAPDYTFTLTLPAQSFLTTYDSLTTLNATTNAQTEYGDNLTASGFASLAAGTNLVMHGYLLRDTSGNYSFTVATVSQVESSGM